STRGSAPRAARRLHPKPPPTLWGGADRPVSASPGFTLSGENVATLALPPSADALAPGEVVLGIRPEHVALDPTSALRGRIAIDEYLGSARCLHLDTPVGRL